MTNSEDLACVMVLDRYRDAIRHLPPAKKTPLQLLGEAIKANRTAVRASNEGREYVAEETAAIQAEEAFWEALEAAEGITRDGIMEVLK